MRNKVKRMSVLKSTFIILFLIFTSLLNFCSQPIEKKKTSKKKEKSVITFPENQPSKKQIETHVYWICRLYKNKKTNPTIINGIILAESSYRNGLLHPGGVAVGLMGIKKITLEHFQMFNPSARDWTWAQLQWDWKKKIAVGIWTFNTYLKMKNNCVKEALTAYRHGPDSKKRNNLYAISILN